MTLVELDDRATIAAFFRRNAGAHVYELGDLDDFDWPHTHWFAWEHGGRLEQVALLYSEPSVPVLIAIAEEPAASMVSLLMELLPRLSGRPLRACLAAAPPGVSRPVRGRIRGAAPQARTRPHRAPRAERRPVDLLGEDDLLARRALSGCVLGDMVQPADAPDWPLRRDPPGRPPRLRCRRARPLANLGSGGARERCHAAGASWARAGACGLRGSLPAAARGRDRDDRPQREGGQRRRIAAYSRLGFEVATSYWEAGLLDPAAAVPLPPAAFPSA